MDEQKCPRTPMSSLSRIAFKTVCSQLEKSLSNEKASASFACGGTIPVKCTHAANLRSSTAEEVPETGERLKSSGPVNIFWELNDASTARKLTLPLSTSVETNDSSSSMTRLGQLVADCEPAPFGRNQETVLDTQYRKAGKLETHQFATTFHPADFGIIERVEQVLLPSLQKLMQQFLEIRRLEVELYKLNVYSGPSGLFKSHVDTPRSKNQIGSLVVCLPSPFKGGSLIVRHGGREVKFGWEHQSADTIQWAAFYSDCEHEITMVNQGERITLTYNLYAVTELLDKADRVSAIIDPKSFPLYRDFKNLLEMPGFMKTGGVLGAFCSHAYPHATSDASILLPRGLKGADLVFYSALHALGVEVDVLPVMLGHGYKNTKDDWWDSDEGKEPDHDTNSDDDDEDGDNGRKKRRRKNKKNQDSNGPLEYLDPGKKVRVGKCLNSYVAAEMYEEEPFSEILNENWPTRCYEKPITWVTAPRPENIRAAMTYMAYGNEASQAEVYSYAAIIAVIPPWTERQKLLAKLEEK
ncbi:Oxoglutarate/iron-dependent dioxygenase [Penicillium cataractarum]|uniref:Oxoglutarate/iron-dependent dioxygenase n=1 Tax=Penicillium cataractarum TaxID=2100454 RepID=A0A9W9SMU7_9EURO|nr:Oxoglutarate/iron-dependent dioxygenase [Penicillium cataractarum]KAJ5381350.1 Oxoglutarate/iron-dependent dioxygenase [Penicillium cataractarum]